VIGERDLSVSFMTDFTKESNDVASVAAAGEITARYNDAKRYCKTALARGMDHTLSPTLVCRFTARLACSLIAALSFNRAHGERLRAARQVAGQSSWAHASHAGTGRDTAKRFGVAYDWNRLVSDPVYNTQIGAAEVAALLKEYRGSHIMPRAGYNAGRGRVEEWVAKHGDPRDPKVDAVDWVERIPFAETRNCVQRAMENLQVYSARFGASRSPTCFVRRQSGGRPTQCWSIP
jgi:soluble lytic murein transglycosylase